MHFRCGQNVHLSEEGGTAAVMYAEKKLCKNGISCQCTVPYREQEYVHKGLIVLPQSLIVFFEPQLARHSTRFLYGFCPPTQSAKKGKKIFGKTLPIKETFLNDPASCKLMFFIYYLFICRRTGCVRPLMQWRKVLSKNESFRIFHVRNVVIY